MKKQYILPGAVLLGGVVGFFLRRWELETAFDFSTGLAKNGAAATLALIGCSLGVVVLFALLGLGKYGHLRHCDAAFAAQGDTPYLTLMLMAGFAMVIAGGVNLLTSTQAYEALVISAAATQSQVHLSTLAPRLGTGVTAILGGLGIVLMGKRNFRNEPGNYNCLAPLMPAYAACLFLITIYQTRSGDPIVLDYVYELLACVGCVLSTYFIAGFSFQNGRGYLTVLTCAVTGYLTLTTLADSHEVYQTVLFLAYLCYLLAACVALLGNSQKPPAPARSTIDTDEIIDREAPPHEA